MNFLLPSGFTKIDHETQMQTLMNMPDRCAKAYVFLLSLSRLRAGNQAAHWGVVAAAISKGRTQTFAALEGLAELGIAEMQDGMWALSDAGAFRKSELGAQVNPAQSSESRRISVRNPVRKSELSDEKNAFQNEEKQPSEEVEELEEGKKTDNNKAQEGTALDFIEGFEPLEIPEDLEGQAAYAANTQQPSDSQDSVSTSPELEPENATSKKNVPAARPGAARFDPLTLTLPPAISPDVWADWCAHRREIRKPMTERAAVLTLQGLEAAAGLGWSPGELIAEAIMRRWTGCTFDSHKLPNPRPAHIVAFPPQVQSGDEYDMEALFASGTAFGSRTRRV